MTALGHAPGQTMAVIAADSTKAKADVAPVRRQF